MKVQQKLLLILLSLFGLGSLVYTMDLKQKNPETIFLTKASLDAYQSFKTYVPEKQTLVLKKVIPNIVSSELKRKEFVDKFYHELNLLSEQCQDTCEVITERGLSKKDKTDRDLMKVNDDSLVLESKDFVAAIFIDDNEIQQKKILQKAHENPYWNPNSTKWAGISYTNFLLDRYSEAIQKTLFPSMFILGFLITFFFIKKFSEALILYLPCLYTAGFSLFVLKLLDGHMNMVTSIIPLVVFTISLSLSFHIFYSIKEYKTVKNFLIHKWKPIFLMMFTTYIGFLSLIVAEISVIQKFGLISSHVILFATFFILFWYRIIEEKLSESKNEGRVLVFKNAFNFSLPMTGIVVIILISLFSVIYLPKKLPIITDATLYFPKSSKFREDIVTVTKTVSGMPITDIVIHRSLEFNEDEIKYFEDLENALAKLQLSQKYKILSNNQLLLMANFKYSGEKIIPSSLPQYLTLRSQLPFSLQESYPVEKKYRLTFLGEPLNVKEYLSDLNKIENLLKTKKLHYTINGMHHNLMTSQNAMIDVLFNSFVSSAFVVFVFSAFYLRSLKFMLSFIIVNTVPILFSFIFMKISSFSINIATVMTFSIALGLLGDSSFHIIHANTHPFKNYHDYLMAVLMPILVSGLLLFLCFVIFITNDFLPIREFGGIMAFILCMGTLSDLYILPRLIYGNSKHRESYEALINQKKLGKC